MSSTLPTCDVAQGRLVSGSSVKARARCAGSAIAGTEQRAATTAKAYLSLANCCHSRGEHGLLSRPALTSGRLTFDDLEPPFAPPLAMACLPRTHVCSLSADRLRIVVVIGRH